MRWLERLEDRCPVWAVPWLLLGFPAGAALLIWGARRELANRLAAS